MEHQGRQRENERKRVGQVGGIIFSIFMMNIVSTHARPYSALCLQCTYENASCENY